MRTRLDIFNDINLIDNPNNYLPFQVQPNEKNKWLRRDSPFFIYLPEELRQQRYNYVIKERQEWRLLFDVDESWGCRVIWLEHIKDFVEW